MLSGQFNIEEYMLSDRCKLDDQFLKTPIIKTHLFNIDDYMELNKDLYFFNKEEYVKHWNNIGIKELRLCNKEQLIVSNEFGIEIIFYIGYYYYLYKKGLLFDNKINTYIGMRPYYYFLPNDQIIEHNKTRIWHPPIDDKLLTTGFHQMVYVLDKRYWIPPDYKTYYKNNIFKYDKEIIVINNKYNIEWNYKPINYISLNTLTTIFEILSDKYQIIYIRPGIQTTTNMLYSWDDNDNKEYNDMNIIKERFKDIIIFEDLLNDKKMSYNELKCYLFASCDNYISVQGGANNLISYFAKHMIILHCAGLEIKYNIYNERALLQCPKNKLKIEVARNDEEYLEMINKRYGKKNI